MYALVNAEYYTDGRLVITERITDDEKQSEMKNYKLFSCFPLLQLL